MPSEGITRLCDAKVCVGFLKQSYVCREWVKTGRRQQSLIKGNCQMSDGAHGDGQNVDGVCKWEIAFMGTIGCGGGLLDMDGKSEQENPGVEGQLRSGLGPWEMICRA